MRSLTFAFRLGNANLPLGALGACAPPFRDFSKGRAAWASVARVLARGTRGLFFPLRWSWFEVKLGAAPFVPKGAGSAIRGRAARLISERPDPLLSGGLSSRCSLRRSFLPSRGCNHNACRCGLPRSNRPGSASCPYRNPEHSPAVSCRGSGRRDLPKD